MRRAVLAVPMALLLATATVTPVVAAGVNGDHAEQQPPPPPPPTSTAGAQVANGTLTTDAGGNYTPTAPHGLQPPSRLRYYAPSAPPPDGTPCAGPGRPVSAGTHDVTVYGSWSPSTAAGDSGTLIWTLPDGSQSTMVATPDARQHGNEPNGTYDMSSADAGSHIYALTVPVTPGAYAGGKCVGATYGTPLPPTVTPYTPTSPCPGNVCPPPPGGVANLFANLKQQWKIGGISTLPGPNDGGVVYVTAPTCAWLSGSTVPQTGSTAHAYTRTPVADDRGQYDYTLRYTATVIPRGVDWDFGDGDHSGAVHERGAGSDPGNALPQFDQGSYTWTPGGCTVWHRYTARAPGVTITASEHFAVSITVSWSDGLSDHTLPVPCAGQPACDVAIGPADGWSSGPHQVDDVRGVPFVGPGTH